MTSKHQDLRFIESNPRVCHGQWVFRGTRILVSVVRQQLRSGLSHEQVIGQWRGKLSLEAVAEAATADVEDSYHEIDQLTA